MKKILLALIILTVLLTAGCSRQAAQRAKIEKETYSMYVKSMELTAENCNADQEAKESCDSMKKMGKCFSKVVASSIPSKDLDYFVELIETQGIDYAGKTYFDEHPELGESMNAKAEECAEKYMPDTDGLLI